ncbi:ABC transporter permease [Romboutsia sedimentorum]|uniref:ABC transporter permease n=1 Tax=Romboutsia sedimentorum TaxID=1368474 RepID=A0ABT7E7Z7_9FIRM|nr:ABC transporter permease [Romboutsia sedimentorum]MDK2563049.1 ABC transporter permease [Romboutsia sedimentorum]
MNYIIEGFKNSIELLVSFDKNLYDIIFLSLKVSCIATFISSIIMIPLGVYSGITGFKFKALFSRLVYTFMSIPSVIVGLVISIILTRNGPLGFLNLMYTPYVMIIAQSVLISPLILGLTYNLSKSRGKDIKEMGVTLGANKLQIVILVIKELKEDMLMNNITAFSRAISEVGAVMVVGGNIKGCTRVMTTSIAMYNSMGDYSMAIALGIVLLLISFIINNITYTYSMED